MSFVRRHQHHFFSFSLFVMAIMIVVVSLSRQSHQEAMRQLGLATPPPERGEFNYQAAGEVPVHINYPLPESTLLPTHPLYSLLMIRDRVRILATIVPEDKAKLLLHLADTRLHAALTLSKQGNCPQAASTAIKAETYLLEAIHQTEATTNPFRLIHFDQIKQAILKHEEVLEIMHTSATGDPQYQISRLHKQLEQYRQLVVSLTKEPFGYLRPEDKVPQNDPIASPSATLNEPLDTLTPYF
jgi:hypothetical protein